MQQPGAVAVRSVTYTQLLLKTIWANVMIIIMVDFNREMGQIYLGKII